MLQLQYNDYKITTEAETPTAKEIATLIFEDLDDGIKQTLVDEYRETRKSKIEQDETEKEKEFLGYDEILIASIQDFLENGDGFEGKTIEELRDCTADFAEDQADIYNDLLYKKAWIFGDYTEEYLENFGYNNEGFVTLLQRGQWYFYDNFARSVCDMLEDIEGYTFE